MKLMKLAMGLCLGLSSAAQAVEDVKFFHIQMGGSYHVNFMQEISARSTIQGEKVRTKLIPAPNFETTNPFNISKLNFDLGEVFATSEKTNILEVPIAGESDLTWFQRARQTGNLPDFMIISGHHVPGLGWHSHYTWGDKEYYTHSLLLASMLRLREENADAKAFFDNVKFVFISGCWGMANLEPHKKDGSYLSTAALRSLYASGEEGQQMVRGTAKQFYSLAGQRHELTTLYAGDIAPKKENAICEPGKPNRCTTYFVNDILSDQGLLDGSHRYNQPYNMRKLFPHAALVFGFHSPSPYNHIVKTMLAKTLSRARQSSRIETQDQSYANNIIHSIISDQTPEQTKKHLIQAFREAWTTVTWENNQGSMPFYSGGRPGSSITPAYPELDNDGIFAWPAGYKNPAFAPRCSQYRGDAKPCEQ